MKNWFEKLQALSWAGKLHLSCPMAPYTTFKIGGPAAALLDIGSASDVQQAIGFAKENGVRAFVMGNGSNLLVRDEGFDGLILRMGDAFARISVEQTRISAQSGALLGALSHAALAHGLTGLEFASGIPGSVGGAVYMNAGAYGGQMADCVVGAQVYLDGAVSFWDREKLDFSYRRSALKSGGIVLETVFELEKGDPAAIAETMRTLNAQRREKQPLTLPSAGSAFKRPQGAFAAELIDRCGLKGLRVGDAQVSEKHAGFIVNLGNARAADVLQLADQVRAAVLEKTGYLLETEFIVL